MEAEANSTLYSIIRSSNVDSLKNWFYMARMVPEAIYLILGTAYEELHLKNVPISREMQFEVEWRLLELQLVTENRRSADSKTTFKQIKEHLDLTCGLINSFLVKNYKTKSKLDMSFVLDAKFVALHISVLKRWLDTYKKIPWEEMESCLVFLILIITKSNEAELTYQFVLDKERVLEHLHYFSEELVDLQSWFNDAETSHPGQDSKQLKMIKDKLEELTKGLPKGRYGAKQIILKSSPNLKYLYEDFYLLRDVFSLKRIKHYLETAISVDIDAEPITGSLVIQRALQVVGEFLKNESESPNISEGLYLILVKLVKVSLQSTFHNLRNDLSHLAALRKRLELEENTNKNLFKSIQIDFKTINAEITRVLYQRKIDALKVLLRKILKCTTFEEINNLLQYIDINKLDELNVIEVPSLSFVKDLVLMFWQEIIDTILDFKDVGQVIEAIDRYESRIEETSAMYKTVIRAICRISKSGELIKSQCLAQSFLSILNNLDPKGIFEEEIIGFLQIIYNNYRKLRGIELDDTTSKDKELIKVTKILMKIHGTLKWELQTIKGVEEIGTALKSDETDRCYWKEKIESLFNQIREKLDISDKHIFLSDLEKKQNIHNGKISLLKSIKQEDFEEKLAQLELENKNIKTVLLNSYNKKKYEELKERINGRIPDEYGLLLKNLEKNGSIFPLDKYFKALNKFVSTVFSKNQQLIDKITSLITDITIQEIQVDYNKRLDTLNKVNASISDFQLIEHNSSVVAALEILILDLTEYLVKINSLYDNKALLVEKLPLLNGKQLRNHLAHESIVSYILPYDTDIPVFVYTQGLINLDTNIITQMGRWTLGFRFISGDNDMSKYINKCQSTVKLQDHLFRSIQDGCFDDTLTLLKAGADLYGRNEIGLTALDISVKNENKKCTDYFMTNLIKNEKDVFQYVSPYTIMKNWTTFNYFLHNTDFNIDFIGANNSKTLLHIAAEIGQFEIVEFLLKHTTKINNTTNFGETALHLAVKSGHLNIVILLLDHNANIIDHQTNRGATALHIASENGYCDLVNELIRKGADFSIKTLENSLENYNAFELAVRSGHQHIVSMFLSLHKNEILLEEREKALLLASQWGNSKVVEILLQLNLNVNAKTSALFNAAAFGYVDVVKLLLKFGAIVNSKHLNDATPLHVACSNGHLELVNILLNENADINALDENMWSPLHYACKNNHLNIINSLILKCANIWSVDAKGLTPFHVASENGCNDSLQLLLQKYPDAVDHLTENTGWSALQLAAGKGHVEIVKLLLTRGAEVNSLATDKTSPLHWAIQRHGYVDVVTILIEYGAKINLKNNQGATPLHTAVLNQNEAILEMLLYHGADPKIPNKSMYTPLHLAAMGWNRNIVNELLKIVDDVNIRDHLSQTPLHLAATQGCAEIVEILLVKSANCNLFDINHVTPLHLAAYNGHIDVAKLLVDYGARVNELDNIHRSPLFMAVNQGHEELAMFLIQKGAHVKQRLNKDVTIFSTSINKGLTNVVSEIIKSGIDINEPYCQSRINPLVMALLGGHESIALVLLEQIAINVLTSTITGWTPLHVACGKGFKTCVDKILTLRPDINARSDKQETPLYFAAEKGHDDIVKLLIEHGAEIDVIAESSYPTALSSAVRNGHQKVAATLIQHGADVNIKCHRGTTILHMGILAEYTEIAKSILACEKTFINAQADGSWTALHFAVLKGNTIILNLLLERDVTDIINAITDDGNTALHYASDLGHKEIVTMLIEHNADVSIRNLDGLTGEDIASRKGFDDIVLLYKKYSD